MAPPRRRVYLMRHADVRYVGSLDRPQRPEDRFLGGETWGSLRRLVP